MVKESLNGQVWEVKTMEMLAGAEEKELLDIALHAATSLCYWLSQVKAALKADDISSSEKEDMLLKPIGRTAVLLDVLQLRYGDASEHEMAYLQNIEDAFE